MSDDAFWALVAPPNENGCRLWTGPQWGGREGERYGQYTDGRWTYYAHRFAYSVKKGPIPVNGRVLHKCDVRLCCEEAHLFLGTQKDNVRDMAEKGRDRKAFGEDHGLARLNTEQVLAIFKDQRTQKTIAKEYGVGLTCVSNIKTGFTWGHVTGKKRVA